MSNKRIRSRRPSLKDDLFTDLDLPAPKRQRQLKTRAREVDEEIQRLECAIAATPQWQKHQAISRRNILPPSEETRASTRVRRAAKALPLNARKQQQQRRLLQIGQFVLLLFALAAASGWVKQLVFR